MRSRYPNPGSALEYYLWVFVRLSAALMLLAGAFGLAYAVINGRVQIDVTGDYRWSFMPLHWHLQSFSIPNLVPTWQNPLWRVYALVLVAVAATHGANGFRVILEDYIHRPVALLLAKGLVFVLLLFMLGTAALIIFDVF